MYSSKIRASFEPVKSSKPKDVQESHDILIGHLNRLARQLTSMKMDIERGVNAPIPVVIAKASSAKLAQTITASIVIQPINITLAAGDPTPISLSGFSAAPSVSQPRCYNAAGQGVAFDMTQVLISGFTVTAMEDCSFDCIAVGF
jgi:hypothetical protein